MTKKLAEEVNEPIEVKEPTKANSAFLEAYKKQNPEKYAAKLAKGEFKNIAAVAAVILIGVVAVFGGAKAYQSYSGEPKVIVEGNYIEAAQVVPDSEVLGAVSSETQMGKMICANGDCTYHVVAPFAVGTSTFVSFLNPYGSTATATVDLVKLDIRTAASTTASDMYFNCGASAGPTGISSVDLLNVDQFPADAVGLVENNLTAALGGYKDGGTVAKITLNPTYPYFTCFVSSTAVLWNSAATETFAGKATVRINHTR